MSEHFLISPCCNAAIDVYGLTSDQIACPRCSKIYEVREDIDFAEFSSGSDEYFKWAADGTHIVRFHFHNMTLDQIDGIAENIKILPLTERRPFILLPVFKAIHDVLKKRLQQHLVFDRVPNLSPERKALIEADLPTPGYNLSKLMELLAEAYPHESARIAQFRDNEKLEMIRWIRNKEEHIATALWPMRSYVHIDSRRLPADDAGHVAELSIPLAVELLNFGIDLLKLIYDLDPKDVRSWHYETLEQYRIHCTV